MAHLLYYHGTGNFHKFCTRNFQPCRESAANRKSIWPAA